MKTLRERFDAKWIPEPFSGCWLWTACINKHGYGNIGLGRKVDGWESAHRVSWRLHRGDIPIGMWVLHTCDVRSCVNPDHLFLGTVLDNNRDCLNKNRRNTPKGESHCQARLTLSQVQEIRNAKEPIRKIGKRFRICQTQVWEIKHNKAWKT